MRREHRLDTAGQCRREMLERFGIIGSAPEFLRAFDQLGRFALSDVPVLLCGETGTGKELAARACHYSSERAERPFVRVNCGALPDHLLEDELFGHAAGAFTDARHSRPGLVKEAEGGTLFLDEVDSLSCRGQVALLHFLQDGSFRPVGADRELVADLRVVAATNAPLGKLAMGGSFRGDLLFRLDVARVTLPSLRERAEDIVPLARHFLNRIGERDGRPPHTLGSRARSKLRSYHWPGNVRELENAMERAVLLSPPGSIDHQVLPGSAAPAAASDRVTLPLREARARSTAAFERDYLDDLLRRAQGNITTAAHIARTERRHLGRMIKRNGIDSDAYRSRGGGT